MYMYMYMYMYMSSWLTIGIHVHVPCRGSFGFTAGEADRWLPPLSCATRHVRDWTEPATLASHRPAKQHLPEGFSHPCHQDLQRGLLNPVEEKLSSEGSSTRNPASPQQNMDL